MYHAALFDIKEAKSKYLRDGLDKYNLYKSEYFFALIYYLSRILYCNITRIFLKELHQVY